MFHIDILIFGSQVQKQYLTPLNGQIYVDMNII